MKAVITLCFPQSFHDSIQVDTAFSSSWKLLPLPEPLSSPKARHCSVCGRRCSRCRMLGAGSVFLEAKTKTKLSTASSQKKMMQDGPVCLADGHLDKRRRIIIFCSKMKIGGMGQKVRRPSLSASRTSLLFDLSQKGLHFGASKSAWQVIATHPPAAALAKEAWPSPWQRTGRQTASRPGSGPR